MTRMLEKDRSAAMLALVDRQKASILEERAKSAVRASARTVAETIGHRISVVDLGTALGQLQPAVIDVTGYSVTIAKGGSDRAAVIMDLGEAGVFGPVYPGMTIRPRKKFTRIRIRKWFSASLPALTTFMDPGVFTVGRYITLAIGKTEESEFEDPSTEAAGFIWQRSSSGVQTYNSLLNVPSNAADGINICGARSIRLILEDVNGNVAGGTIVWWYYAAVNGIGLASWAETDVQQVLPTGRQVVSPSELEVAHASGRLFPELRSYTNSVAGTAPNLYIQCFGEGGELRAGDVSL